MYVLSHRTTTFDKESIGAAFGRAPQGRGAPLWLLSLSNVVVLWLRTCILQTSVGLGTSESWIWGAKWCDSPADTPKGQDYQGKNEITSLVAKGPLTPSMGKIKVGVG